MRREKKYNYIYKTTCDVTGKYYIGMHSTDDLNDGYMGSGKRLWYSFNYHGKNNHSIGILEWYDTRKELKEREKELVNEDLLKEDLCMNLKTGGDGGFVNEKHRQKFMDSKVGTTNFVNRFKEDEEFKDKIVKTLRDGYKKAHLEGKLNVPKRVIRIISEETKQKMSETSKGMGVGKTNSQYGTYWITKDGSNKKIKKEDLNGYIEEGWVKGRLNKRR